jgi:hypothetical protein
MKSLIKRALNRAGYQLVPTSARSLRWPKPDTPAPHDEVVPGHWFYHALQMRNRSYSPQVLEYHRTIYGEDERLKYMMYFLDVRDQRVLELGPLEGHHSIILEKMGVRENISIESRDDNLVKCRRIKDKYKLDRTQFLKHNLELLADSRETPSFPGAFDLVFCVGVLYHLPEPVKALKWMRERAPMLFLGTHYTEPEEHHDFAYRHNGKTYKGKEYVEGGLSDGLSGMSPSSFWPYEPDLIAMVRDAGYSKISVLGRDLQNTSPHITILAQ